MSSTAAFSASTISAFSIVRRRCPPAVISIRPTAPRGWCSSASRCCALRSSWRCTNRTTRSSWKSSSGTRWPSRARWTGSATVTTRCGTRKTASSTTCCASPTASATRLKVRSIVGLLPLAAVAVFEDDILVKLPKFRERARQFLDRHPELARSLHLPGTAGVANRRMLSIVDETKLRRILTEAARRGRVPGPPRHPRAVTSPSRASVRVPPRWTGASRRLRARRLGLGNVRRQFQLARAGVDADQFPAVHGAAAPLRLLRRGLQGRMPDRLGDADDADGGGAGNSASG